MGHVVTPTKTFRAAAAIGIYLRVKLSAGKVAVAGASDTSIGTNENHAVFNADELASIRLRSTQGTVPMVAAAAVNVGDPVYGAASGKVSTTPNREYEGIALTAAANDGDVIEVARTLISPISLVGPTNGNRFVAGQANLSGTNPTAIASGLSTLLSANVVLAGTTAPGLGTQVLKAELGTGGAVLVSGFKQTNATNAALIASDGTETFNYIIIGT